MNVAASNSMTPRPSFAREQLAKSGSKVTNERRNSENFRYAIIMYCRSSLHSPQRRVSPSVACHAVTHARGSEAKSSGQRAGAQADAGAR
eukprot:5521905-Pleurochrysis_carterae.AAC.1